MGDPLPPEGAKAYSRRRQQSISLVRREATRRRPAIWRVSVRNRTAKETTHADFQTEAEARAAYDNLLRRVAVPTKRSRPTVADGIEHFLEHCPTSYAKDPHARAQDQRSLRSLAKALGDRQIRELELHVVNAALESVAPGSSAWNNTRRVWQRVLDYWRDRRLLTRTIEIRPKPAERGRGAEPLTHAEAQALLDVLRGRNSWWAYHYARVAMETGVKAAWIVSWIWADIDLNRSLWRVPTGKTTDRAILHPLSPRAVKVLRNFALDGAFYGVGRTGRQPLFGIEPRSVSFEIERCEAAVGRPLALEDLRLTYYAIQRDLGTPIDLARSATGRGTDRGAERVYGITAPLRAAQLLRNPGEAASSCSWIFSQDVNPAVEAHAVRRRALRAAAVHSPSPP
jgi:hypothetical protein